MKIKISVSFDSPTPHTMYTALDFPPYLEHLVATKPVPEFQTDPAWILDGRAHRVGSNIWWEKRGMPSRDDVDAIEAFIASLHDKLNEFEILLDAVRQRAGME